MRTFPSLFPSPFIPETSVKAIEDEVPEFVLELFSLKTPSPTYFKGCSSLHPTSDAAHTTDVRRIFRQCARSIFKVCSREFFDSGSKFTCILNTILVKQAVTRLYISDSIQCWSQLTNKTVPFRDRFCRDINGIARD